MAAIVGDNLFELGEEAFAIEVDYDIPLHGAWSAACKHVVSWGNLELRNRTFKHTGQRSFVGSYATLVRDDPLWEMQKDFEKAGVMPADMRQLFAFIERFHVTEITLEKNSAIVAAAEGSTWRCSHDCLQEMAGMYWDNWYHNPGPCLHTESQGPREGFEKGTRFLSILH